jgi:two-component system, NarL family, response regulator NreC
MTALRVCLAEDHAVVREGLKLLINSQPDMEVVGEAGDGREALIIVSEYKPDVVVLDVSMPKMNGLQVTEKLTRTHPDIKLLTLTRHADNGFLQQLFRAGAVGYVLKQSPPGELLNAIRTVASGSRYLDPALTTKVLERLTLATVAPNPELVIRLSDRESEVLKLIAVGYSNKEIAARLSISVKTVEAHKANAMKKLGISSRIDIVRYAMLQGWLDDL